MNHGHGRSLLPQKVQLTPIFGSLDRERSRVEQVVKQAGWGTPTTLNLKRFFNLGWQVPTGGGAEFSFCIDDVSFF
jgi:hypothetical protein